MFQLGYSHFCSVSKEAQALLHHISLSGRCFTPESVAAGCIFVALRSHRVDVTLEVLARRLTVDKVMIAKVVKHLNKDTNCVVQGIKNKVFTREY